LICQGNINNKQTIDSGLSNVSQRVYRNPSTRSFSSHLLLWGIHIVFFCKCKYLFIYLFIYFDNLIF
jgi:hypothetical protein